MTNNFQLTDSFIQEQIIHNKQRATTRPEGENEYHRLSADRSMQDLHRTMDVDNQNEDMQTSHDSSLMVDHIEDT